MKGQSEIIVFVLLFIIGVSLFISAIMWSRGMFDRNSDMAKLNLAESFMRNIDGKIQNIIKFGGQDSIQYGFDATIELVGSDTIEIRTPLSVDIPDQWVNIQSSPSIIREKKDGDMFRIQLYYPSDTYSLYLYTEGPKVATPQKITIEKGSSFTQGGKTYVKVKITFE